jgi:Leucine-rich repeat (LRR) protein
MLSDIARKLLNISHNLLSELPASLLNMSSLEHLDVSYNKLTRLPTHLSKCVSLRVLDVSYNQLESFPSDLALQCHNLQALLLDGNPAITTGRITS